MKKYKGNFYPDQYQTDSLMEINHNYLNQQFEDFEPILNEVSKVIKAGDFTLGSAVDNFECDFAKVAGTTNAIGLGSGTDALFLSLKALGVKDGDEVITTPFTFFATVGAIVTAGAKPIFVDCGDDLNINPDLIEEKITSKTKAILPVHWSGRPCEMDTINTIASKYSIPVIEDACHAIKASYKGKPAGGLGDIGCFSFHPLKNLNVWGDGGIATTNSEQIAETLRLIRNHGLIDRNTCAQFSYNSRLDTVQAVVAQYLLDKKINHITESRINNAFFLDSGLLDIPELDIPSRLEHITEVFHLYMFRAKDRDLLKVFLNSNGIDAKIHYPTPMHLQPASRDFGYKKGDFPVCENSSQTVISLPVHEFINKNHLEFMIEKIREFYLK